MKKFLIGWSLTIFIFVVSKNVLFAQTPAPFDFQKAYQDFVFTFDQYKTTETDYQLSRSQYLGSKTLAAKDKAQQSTYKFLQARDEVVKTYLTALRMKMGELPGVSGDRKQLLQTKLDEQVSWFNGHKTGIPSAASLEDLVIEATEAKTQYDKITEPIIYESLTEIAIGKENHLRQRQKSIIEDLKSKVAEIRQNGDLSTDIIERNILEVENRVERSEGKEAEVRTLQNNFVKDKKRAESFNTVVFRVSEAVQYLKEANTYLKEILGQIKRGQ